MHSWSSKLGSFRIYTLRLAYPEGYTTCLSSTCFSDDTKLHVSAVFIRIRAMKLGIYIHIYAFIQTHNIYVYTYT